MISEGIMNQSRADQYDKGEEPLRPIDELLEKPHNTNLYPNLIEDYHNLADKDIHLAELYRFAATSQGNRLIPNPVQAVKVDGEMWVDVLVELESTTSQDTLAKIMNIHSYTRRFVSGRILVQRLPELTRYVKRMQTGRPVYLTLDDSIPDIHADHKTLSQHFAALNIEPTPTGKNVIIGIVDANCDFLHPNFLDDEGKTRIKYLWDQNGTPELTNGSNLPYGREYDEDFINQAIQNISSYKELGYEPATDAHGTHVMDIAGGNSSIYPGVAPEADLIFVHLGLPNTIEAEKGFLGSSNRLYDAVRYIYDKADEENKPAVVNLSLATNGGPHDGTSLVETMLDDLLEEHNGRAVVLAAGNSYHHGIHAMGTVNPNMPSELKWEILCRAPEDWGQRQEMEIWYEGETHPSLDVFDPNGKFIGSCEFDETLAVTGNGFSEPYMLIHYNFDDEANENHINIFIDDRHPELNLEGAYSFILKLPHGSNDVAYHAWIELNKEYPSNFSKENQEPQYTISSIANGKLPIIVGAYNPENEKKTMWFGSSSGPSRNVNALEKPTISAPGESISAARSYHYSSGDRTKESGTSQAAPHVTGVIALMFQTARDLCMPPKELNISQIRQTLIDTADRNPPQGGNGVHDLCYGYGRINCERALNQVLS
jgi:subtilisin family serine protease